MGFILIKVVVGVARHAASSCPDPVRMLSCIASFCRVSVGTLEMRIYFLASKTGRRQCGAGIFKDLCVELKRSPKKKGLANNNNIFKRPQQP
jgi:hypothetical protein